MTTLLPKLSHFPATLPTEGAVRLELEEGIPVFRASDAVQTRIETLLAKHKAVSLSEAEIQELDADEEMDDYLSFVNRTVRNLYSDRRGEGGHSRIESLHLSDGKLGVADLQDESQAISLQPRSTSGKIIPSFSNAVNLYPRDRPQE
jgi:hypothetical protein